MAYIPEGCIFVARKMLDSEIWNKKPTWWIKVWIYILIRVNHKSNRYFVRGQGFFSMGKIHDECKLQLCGIKEHTVDNVLRWLKSTKQITTQKTTRGIVITVCNYNAYQNIASYKNDTENETENEIETKQKRNRNETIYNNDNNDNNVNKEDVVEFFNYYLLKTKKNFKLTPINQSLIKQRLNKGFTVAQLKQAVDNFVQDDWPERKNYLDLTYCIGVTDKIDNLEKWINFKSIPKFIKP